MFVVSTLAIRGHLKTGPRTPTGFVDYGLRTPVIYILICIEVELMHSITRFKIKGVRNFL